MSLSEKIYTKICDSISLQTFSIMRLKLHVASLGLCIYMNYSKHAL